MPYAFILVGHKGLLLNNVQWHTNVGNSHYEKFLATGEVKCIDEEIPFEIPQGWEWARMSTISLLIHYGYTASAASAGNVKLLRITDIQNGQVSWPDVPFCSIADDALQNYLLEKDDIVIARTGGTVGKSFIIPSLSVESVFASYLIRIKLLKVSIGISMDYLASYLDSPCYWQQLIDATSGTGQPNVNGQSLSRLLVPIPPIPEQIRIASKLEVITPFLMDYTASQQHLDNLNGTIKDKLKKSILQEAIQGRLVPQDPNDEPASVLLDRIREEKQKLLKEGKIKKKDITDSVIFKGEDNKYYEKVGSQVMCIDDEIPFEIPDSWEWVRIKIYVK